VPASVGRVDDGCLSRNVAWTAIAFDWRAYTTALRFVFRIEHTCPSLDTYEIW
jgi:hypothetical protein